MSTFNQNEVLVSTDNAGQLWNICVWDAHSGSSLTAFKGDYSLPKTLCNLGNSYFVSASPTTNSAVVQYWLMGPSEQTCKKCALPGKVSALGVTPCNTYLFAGIGTELRSWMVSTGQPLGRVSQHFAKITVIAFTEDSGHVITGSDDTAVHAWALFDTLGESDALGGRATPRYTWKGHALPITDLAVGLGAAPRIASVSLDKVLKLWCMATGTLLLDMVFDCGLTCVAMDTAEWRLFAGSTRGDVFAVDLLRTSFSTSHQMASGETIMEGHTKEVTCLAVSMDGSTLATGSADCDVRIWDVSSGQTIKTISHKGKITNLLLMPAPQRLLAVDPAPPTLPVSSLAKSSGGAIQEAPVPVFRPFLDDDDEAEQVDALRKEVAAHLAAQDRQTAPNSQNTAQYIKELEQRNKQLYHLTVDQILE